MGMFTRLCPERLARYMSRVISVEHNRCKIAYDGWGANNDEFLGKQEQESRIRSAEGVLAQLRKPRGGAPVAKSPPAAKKLLAEKKAAKAKPKKAAKPKGVPMSDKNTKFKKGMKVLAKDRSTVPWYTGKIASVESNYAKKSGRTGAHVVVKYDDYNTEDNESFDDSEFEDYIQIPKAIAAAAARTYLP